MKRRVTMKLQIAAGIYMIIRSLIATGGTYYMLLLLFGVILVVHGIQVNRGRE